MTHVDALLLQQQQRFRADELRAATDRAGNSQSVSWASPTR